MPWAEEVSLWVVEDNRQAHDLYLKTGFAETELKQPLPSDDSLIEVKMVMSLAEKERT